MYADGAPGCGLCWVRVNAVAFAHTGSSRRPSTRMPALSRLITLIDGCPARQELAIAASVAVVSSATLWRNREIVELDHRVRLGPEADLSRLKRIVARVEYLRAIEPHDEVIPTGFHLQGVPRIACDFDRMVLKRPATAVDDVVDRAVVLQRVATSDVVVVRVAVAPHDSEALIDFAGERPCANRQRHVAE